MTFFPGFKLLETLINGLTCVVGISSLDPTIFNAVSLVFPSLVLSTFFSKVYPSYRL